VTGRPLNLRICEAPDAMMPDPPRGGLAIKVAIGLRTADHSSYFLAISLRCQARSVSGVTMVACV
jgi:hypothetical protein